MLTFASFFSQTCESSSMACQGSPGGAVFGGGASDFLDMLAEVASRELASGQDQLQQPPQPQPSFKAPAPRRGRRGSTGRNPRKRLVDYDEFDVDHIVHMTSSTLLRLFSEQNFDEVGRQFAYTCAFLPHLCAHQSRSFGSENRAKADMKAHLATHVRHIRENPAQYADFTAESVPARKRRMESLAPPPIHDYPDLKQEEEEMLLQPEKRVKLEISEEPPKIKQEDAVAIASGSWAMGAHLPSAPRSVMDEHCYFSTNPNSAKKKEPICRAASPGAEEKPEKLAAQWVQAVMEGKRRDRASRPMFRSMAAGGTFLDYASTSWVFHLPPTVTAPAVGAEVIISDPKAPLIVSKVPRTSGKRSRPGSACSQGGDAVIPNENLSPDELLERQKALEAIQELKNQGSTAVDFWCRLCAPNRKFTAYTTLLSHLRSHAGVRPYECPVCSAVFTRQHSLNYHMLIHDNKMRFTCPDCGKKFRHPSHYKEHLRRHTGESPYECSECTVRYKTRNTYKRHLKVFHGKELTAAGDLKALPEEELARIKSSELKREQEKLERRKRKQEKRDAEKGLGASVGAHIPRCDFPGLDNEEDDEEVAKISQQLQEREGFLDRKVVLRVGGDSAASSEDDGSYYPSTDSEFSSPEPTPSLSSTTNRLEAEAEEATTSSSHGDSKASSPAQQLPEFGDSPPANLVYTAPSRGASDSPEKAAPLAIKNHDKSPNLLESVDQSAFNPIKQERRLAAAPSMHSQDQHKTPVRRITPMLETRPVGLQNPNIPKAAVVLPSYKTTSGQAPIQVHQKLTSTPPNPATVVSRNEAIWATSLDGKQVLLIPTPPHSDGSCSGNESSPDQKGEDTAVGGPSKLEQCLRYGSAAAMSSGATAVSTASIAASVPVTRVVTSAAVGADGSAVPQQQLQQQKPATTLGHTFVLKQPISLNINKVVPTVSYVSTIPTASTSVPAHTSVRGTSATVIRPAPAAATAASGGVRKINSIRLVPVAASASTNGPAVVTATSVGQPHPQVIRPARGTNAPKIIQTIPAGMLQNQVRVLAAAPPTVQQQQQQPIFIRTAVAPTPVAAGATPGNNHLITLAPAAVESS